MAARSVPPQEASSVGQPAALMRFFESAALIPIIEVAFRNNMWWSIPANISAELYAQFQAGNDAVYTYDWGDQRQGSWRPDNEDTTINRYHIDFTTMTQKNIDNGRLRTVRIVWAADVSTHPQWTGQIPQES